MDETQSARRTTGKDSSKSAGETTSTLLRCSSDPTSLSSGADETAAGADLLERARRSVATLQHSLAAKRDRCRRLEAQDQPILTPNTFDAILRYIDHERSNSRQLHSTILRQRKTIVKLRRQLRAVQLRTTVNCCDSSEDVDDSDDSVSDFQVVSVDPECRGCTANNCHKMVHHNTFILYVTATVNSAFYPKRDGK